MKFSPFRSTGFIAMLLIAMVMAVQYSGSWYGLEMVKISTEAELTKHLKALGSGAQVLLMQPALEAAEIAIQIEQESGVDGVPGQGIPVDGPLAAEAMSLIDASPFRGFAEVTSLKDLTLLDDSGRVLISASGNQQFLAPFDFLEIDRDQFDLALGGESAASLVYEIGDSPLKRVYVPIFDDHAGAVTTVLCLTAGRDYLAQMQGLAKHMGILSVISTISVLLIGLLVYRLLVRQRRFEQRAAHADRLSSLGSLAAGFAHEVRNPLQIITACAQDLERSLGQDPHSSVEATESCRDIQDEVDRMNRLVNQFLQYSRPDTPTEKRSARLALCLESAVGLLKHAAEKRGISIIWSAASIDSELTVAIEPDALRQIVLNLMLNAIQASPDDGRVDVHAEGEPKQVRLIIRDEGPGVPETLRFQIFDPFFTTRAEGSGLGLSIAHQLAVRAGGKIECEDRPSGRGASFVLTLPRPAHERLATAPVTAQPSSPKPEAVT